MQRKNLTELCVVGILIFVLLFIVSHTIKRGRQAKQQRTKRTETIALKEISPAKIPTKELYMRLEEESKDLELRRDPFSGASIAPKERAPSGLDLSGILWDKTNPMAMINDKIVRIGEWVGGSKVVGIKQNRVILNDGTKDFELRLE